jgi:DNA (cytosine-5)-methyltransferase 1
MGYDARWGVLGAADAITYHGPACADHLRNRIWIVGTLADPAKLLGNGGEHYAGIGVERVTVSESGNDSGAQTVADAISKRRRCWNPKGEHAKDAGQSSNDSRHDPGAVGYWNTEPNVDRVAHGVAARVDRLKAIGNGQVPAVAALAWKTLSRNL